jgi:hypothetical protein
MEPAIERAKALLKRINGGPCGTISTPDLRTLSKRVLPYMELFCREFFPTGDFNRNGNYWCVPTDSADFRISLRAAYGGKFFLDHKARGNPLTLWMIAHDIPMDDTLVCRSKTDLEKAVRGLTRWVEDRESGKRSTAFRKDGEYYLMLKQGIFDRLFEGRDVIEYKGSARFLYDKLTEGVRFEEIEVSSPTKFRRLLKHFIKTQDSRLFTVSVKDYPKVSIFTLRLREKSPGEIEFDEYRKNSVPDHIAIVRKILG